MPLAQSHTPWQRLSSRCAGLALKTSWETGCQAGEETKTQKAESKTQNDDWQPEGSGFGGLSRGASGSGASETCQSPR